jgi:tRNA-Thr(GGU) m(6)t(6)A37 methyltransferase TsaA
MPNANANANDNDNVARPGEIALAIDPATLPPDAGIVFIGHAETPYATRKDCPRNSMQDPTSISTLHIDEPYRAGLQGLLLNNSSPHQQQQQQHHVIVLYWMHEARRDLMVQNPNHVEGTKGCFALRTPIRPNPISLSVVQLLESNMETGELKIQGIDCLNGTPIVDIKPYFASTDAKENKNSELK